MVRIPQSYLQVVLKLLCRFLHTTSLKHINIVRRQPMFIPLDVIQVDVIRHTLLSGSKAAPCRRW